MQEQHNPDRSQALTVGASQHNVTLLLGNLDKPPSWSISTKYRAPFNPHGRLETSTSKVNSLFLSLNIM